MYFKNYLLRQLQYKPWPLSFSAFKTLTMPPADNPKQPPESGHVRLYPQNALQKVNIVTNSRKKVVHLSALLIAAHMFALKTLRCIIKNLFQDAENM